jgi:asparagine synthase (glutamine-hydrolysing)
VNPAVTLEHAKWGSGSTPFQDVFFGAVTDGSAASLDLGFAADQPGELPRISSHHWGRSRVVVEGRAESAVSGGQGISLLGRLFNAAELTVQLGPGALDPAALLLQAYRRWGTDFPNYLHGEFTFALWDSQSARILLGRDASCYNPLFYTQSGDNFAFATDLRVLQTRLGLRLRPNEARIANWLTLLSAADNSTFFEGICCLKPGQMLLYERGRTTLNYFWRPEDTPILRLKDPREYADGLLAVLERAVGDRLPRDSAAGSHLSGGLDSSSVTAVAAALLEKEGRRIYGFTAVPEHQVPARGRFCDEGPHAASVMEIHRNLDHVLVPNWRHSFFSIMDRASSAEYQPLIAAPNYGWIYEINVQARRRNVRTLLIGAEGNMTISYGGVEAISTLAMEGRLVAAAKLARDLHRHGGLRRRALANRLLRPWMPAPVRHLVDRFRGQASLVYSPIRPEFARAHGVSMTALTEFFDHLDGRSFRMAALRTTDRSWAAFRQLTGVSMSDPTVDKHVVSYCFSVPVEYFCEGGIPRSLIRNAMAGLLPDRVRLELRKGLQAADFRFHFQTEREEALAELKRMKNVELAVRALDLDSVEQMMQWSEARIAKFGEPVYWGKLTRALSLGRFLRRLEDGTFFSSVPDLMAPAASN